MTIRTKLLLFFLSLSMLTLVVGTVFYLQLKNLVEPLTRSIPESVAQLNNALTKNDLIDRLAFHQLLVSRNLERYVFTQQSQALQDYYENEELLSQLNKNTAKLDPILWQGLVMPFQKIENERNHVRHLVQGGQVSQAKEYLIRNEYSTALEDTMSLLRQYYQRYSVIANETSYVTVRLAAKHTLEIVQESLSIAIIIFINALLISFVLAFLSARTISKPIKLLREDMERISIEDLNIPLNPQLYTFKGELGSLANSFINLINRLRTTTVLRDELQVEVDHRKAIEEKLRHTLKELEQFAYVASHDLRAPLRGISNLIHWIEDDTSNVLSESAKKNFALIKRRIQRLDSLIEGILEYSRVGKANVSAEELNLDKIIHEVIDMLAPPNNVKITVDNSLPIVSANKISITQIFQNLISNAIKYNNKEIIKINLGSFKEGQFYQFYVTDNGPGIAPEYFEKIFEMFQTLQSKDVIESTGIGLAIVKKVIENQGGKIWLTSELNKGTTFYFTWPVNRRSG